MTPRPKRERGVALVAMAAFLALLLGITALGVDLGRLAHTSTEVQAVADAAATAGAVALNLRDGVPGGAEPDAHVVSGANVMNGELAPDADVEVEEGNYDFDTGTFTVGGEKRRAVRATVTTRVTNLVAGVFDFMSNGRLNGSQTGTDFKHSTVTRSSIAGFAGKGVGCKKPADCEQTDYDCWCRHNEAPCLPIAIPECKFGDIVPTGIQIGPSTGDTAAWTGFQVGHDENVIRSLFPPPCANGNADDIDAQEGFGGDTIDVTNGINASSAVGPFGRMECVYENRLGCRDDNGDGIFEGSGGLIFTVPVFELTPTCDTNPTGIRPLVGFATITLDGASRDDKIVTVSAIEHTDSGSIGGSGSTFTGRVTLVQ